MATVFAPERAACRKIRDVSNSTDWPIKKILELIIRLSFEKDRAINPESVRMGEIALESWPKSGPMIISVLDALASVAAFRMSLVVSKETNSAATSGVSSNAMAAPLVISLPAISFAPENGASKAIFTGRDRTNGSGLIFVLGAGADTSDAVDISFEDDFMVGWPGVRGPV